MKLSSKEAALTACFAAVYIVASFIPASPFPLIGGEGRIDASSIVSLIVGLVLGPLLGGLSVLIGGLIAPFVIPSLALGPFTVIPHLAAATCAGALKKGKQIECVFAYLFSFIFFAFFPEIGPFWIEPSMLWFHLVMLAFMASPLQTWAIRNIAVQKSRFLTAGAIVTLLTSTTFSQVVGSIVFEFIKLGGEDLNYWRGLWQSLTFIYPAERLIIACLATIIAVPILRSLKTQEFRI